MDIILNIIKSVIFGIVQGVTEFLPISSTGHLILLQTFMPLNVFTDPAKNKAFLGCIQGRDSVRQYFVCTVVVLEAFMPTRQKRIRAKEKRISTTHG